MRYPHELVSVALTQYNLTEPYDELEKFRDAVLQGIHGLRATNAINSSWIINLYYDSCPYTVGAIWLDTDNEGNLTYTVEARGIDNNKFGSHNNRRFTLSSKDMSKAVRNAKKYFRPYSPLELLGCTVDDAQKHARTTEMQLKEKLMAQYNKVLDWDSYNWSGSDSRLLREFEHLVQSNYSWVDPTFGEDLTAALELLKETRAASERRKGPMYFVRVYEQLRQQVFDVIFIEDLSHGGYIYSINKGYIGTVEQYTEADIPDGLLGKLAVLSMLGADKYCEGVGYNVGEGMFYVTP